MSYHRVVVTGLGCITPVGNNTKDFWNSIVQGKSGVGPLTAFDPARFDCKIAAEVKNYDPKDSTRQRIQAHGALLPIRRYSL